MFLPAAKGSARTPLGPIMPFIVAAYVYASSQGQRTHSARTNIVKHGDGPERDCGICYQYSNKSSTNVRNHIESKHFPGMMSYQCEYCQKTCKTKQSLDTHRQRCNHNETNKNSV